MSFKKDIERCVAYIENNRDKEIDPREMAKKLGYSYNYFCNLFSITTGIPIGEYLRRVKLEEAARDIIHGKSINATAKGRGFHTLSGFNKAFKKAFDMSPRKYKTENQLITGPKIVYRDAIKAVGYGIMPYQGREWSPYENAKLWQGVELTSSGEEAYRVLAAAGKGEIALWFDPQEASGSRAYFFGPIVEDFSYIPESMISIELSSTIYAVFTTVPVNISKNKGEFRKSLDNIWKYIFMEWFDINDEFIMDQEKIPFEYYPSDSAFGKDNPVQIYIPICYKDNDV
ncbi:MAG: AraC family transcriptional regulator [Bacillota bacterium]|nr:AraC family transcriptional regulator [Bacillota bacterium]